MVPTKFGEDAKPSSIAGLELFWVAFWELRSSTNPDDPISWSEREFWGRSHGLDYETRGRLHALVSAMDAEFRKWYRKKQESEAPRGKRR